MLVDRLVKMCLSGEVSRSETKRSSEVLNRLALQWGDSKTWAKALSLRPRKAALQDMGVEGVVKAYKLFAPKFFQIAEP